MGFFDKIKKIGIFNGFSELTEDFYEELEESLVMADLGVMDHPAGGAGGLGHAVPALPVLPILLRRAAPVKIQLAAVGAAPYHHVQRPGQQVGPIAEQEAGLSQLHLLGALYFAILKVRPTPFCVMDEIEAALDESNVVPGQQVGPIAEQEAGLSQLHLLGFDKFHSMAAVAAALGNVLSTPLPRLRDGP